MEDEVNQHSLKSDSHHHLNKWNHLPSTHAGQNVAEVKLWYFISTRTYTFNPSASPVISLVVYILLSSPLTQTYCAAPDLLTLSSKYTECARLLPASSFLV